MNKLILVDGNNLAIRNAFANSDLCVSLVEDKDNFNPDDIFDKEVVFPTSVLHGFLKSIVVVSKEYPDAYIVIVWDGGYDKRRDLTVDGVDRGIIKEGYKQNRRKKEAPQEILDFQKQKPILQNMLRQTNIPQLRVEGEECDDLIASCAVKFSSDQTVIVYSTDKDFYQVLDENVLLLRSSFVSGENTLVTIDDFRSKFGIEPWQWVDVGALAGDTGDNIFSAPGWGEETALKEIRVHKTYVKVLEAFHVELDKYRRMYPDPDSSDLSTFEKLCGISTPSGKPTYPDAWPEMPFLGLAVALHNKTCKDKVSKTKLKALMYEDRIHLAYKLKKMDVDISVSTLPAWERNNRDAFVKYCKTYKLSEVEEVADILCRPQRILV